MSGIISAHYKRVGLSFGFLFFILALCCSGVSTAQEWTTSGTNIHNANSGNVGVGTASPDSALTVTNDDGSVYTGHFKNSNGTSPTLWIEATGNDNNDTGVFKVDVNGSTRFMVSNYDGNVGIGTTSPTQLLHLESAGTPAIALYSSFTGDGANRNWAIRPSHNVWGNLEILQSNAIGGNPITAGTSRLVISPGGNVGIGTTGPASLLQLDNQGTFTIAKGLTFGDGDTGIYEQSNDLMRIAHNGSPIWEISSTRIGGTDRGGGAILNESPSVANPTLLPSTADDDTGIAHDGVTNTNILTIVTGGVERVRVDNNGNVGIGTTTPSDALHVVGNATFSGTVTGGNIQAMYQDVAEWVPASSAILPGTVVILDMAHSNQVVFSSNAYDTRVAGVVSATPGLLLGEGGEGKVKVATTGRVKVKVDATRKPIRVGDLLVTSDQEGMAMRSEPLDFGGIPIHRPGTILGKALESLNEGKGEILVLLTLQ